MNTSLPPQKTKVSQAPQWRTANKAKLIRISLLSAFAGLLSISAAGQAITIDTHGNATTGAGATVDRRFMQIEPTHVELSKTELDTRTRLELLRFLESDQGFAMRPLPRGHRGLTLVANGKLEPAGEPYLAMVTSEGLSAKPGDRVVITDLKFERNKMSIMLNGGPDAKHRFLQHIQLGTGTMMNPVVQGTGEEVTGARITLTFKEHVPQMTGKQVEALLAPLISFEVKTPIQAFTDTLPPKLKAAIMDHSVLVGMSTDMVLFAKGQPQSKIREMDGQMPFEEWVYGKPPSDVEFVRINGNRVIRVEVAKIGKAPEIFTKDEVEGMMRTDGTPLEANGSPGTRTVEMGDVKRNPDTQAPTASPSLRAPGESLPATPSGNDRTGTMRPVQFPKQAPDDHPVAHQGEQKPADGAKPAGEDQSGTAPATGSKTSPASGQQSAEDAPAGSTLPAAGSQPE